MKYLIVTIFALFTPIYSRPQAPQQQPQLATQPRPQNLPQGQQAVRQGQSASGVTPVSIVSQTEVVGPDGSFNYSYDTSNGIHVEQGGYVKKSADARSIDPNNPDATGDIQVIQGAYSYTAPDGQQISLRYIADENGFQPEGEHLPKLPEGIAQQQQGQQFGQQQGHQFGQQQGHQFGQQQGQQFGQQQGQQFGQQPGQQRQPQQFQQHQQQPLASANPSPAPVVEAN